MVGHVWRKSRKSGGKYIMDTGYALSVGANKQQESSQAVKVRVKN
jgi:hypothetical protein